MEYKSDSYILIVDDTKENRELLKLLFKKICYKCLSATSGEESIQLVNDQNDIGLILMDVKMNGMTGIEAMKKIKKNHEIPIVAVTAFTMDDDRDNLIKEGFDDYISKPIDIEMLSKKLKTWIN